MALNPITSAAAGVAKETIGEGIEAVGRTTAAAIEAGGEIISSTVTGITNVAANMLRRPDVTINQMGGVGSAALAAVGAAQTPPVITGAGSLPPRPTAAKAKTRESMTSVQILKIINTHLASIDAGLKAQLDYQVSADREMANAQKESRVENAFDGSAFFSSLKSKTSTAATKIKSAPGDIQMLGGLLGLAALTEGVERLNNLDIRGKINELIDAFNKFKNDYLPGLEMLMDAYLLGKGLSIADMLTGGRLSAGAKNAIKRVFGFAARNPITAVAAAYAGMVYLAVDEVNKGEDRQREVGTEEYKRQMAERYGGLTVGEQRATGGFLGTTFGEQFVTTKYKVRMPNRPSIDGKEFTPEELAAIADENNANNPYYYWGVAYRAWAAAEGLVRGDGSGHDTAAEEWLSNGKGEAWLNSRYPKSVATPQPTGGAGGGATGPDATRVSGPQGNVTPEAANDAMAVNQTAYDIVYGNGIFGSPQALYGKRLSDMTISEVLQFQDNLFANTRGNTAGGNDGEGHTPVGAYQFTKETLLGLMGPAGVSGNTKFDAATQDRMAEILWNQRRGGDMSKTWAYTFGTSPGQFANTNFADVKREIIANEVGSYVNMRPSQQLPGQQGGIAGAAGQLGEFLGQSFKAVRSAMVAQQGMTTHVTPGTVNTREYDMMQNMQIQENALKRFGYSQSTSLREYSTMTSTQRFAQANGGKMESLDPNYNVDPNSIISKYFVHFGIAA